MTEQTKKQEFPLLPLRDVVVFPYMVIPLFVGRVESVKALEVAMESDKRIFLVSQKILIAIFQDKKILIKLVLSLPFYSYCDCQMGLLRY